jgi:hypothetical protein
MSFTPKNIVIGPATISLGGSDLGAIKRGSIEIEELHEHIAIGDNEATAGPSAMFDRFIGYKVRCVLLEKTLANIKAVGGHTETVGGSNPQTLINDFAERMLTPAALVITCAAPRTTAGVAQTATITLAQAVPSADTIKYLVGNTAANEFNAEFSALVGTNDISYSFVNA